MRAQHTTLMSGVPPEAVHVRRRSPDDGGMLSGQEVAEVAARAHRNPCATCMTVLVLVVVVDAKESSRGRSAASMLAVEAQAQAHSNSGVVGGAALWLQLLRMERRVVLATDGGTKHSSAADMGNVHAVAADELLVRQMTLCRSDNEC